MCFSASASFTAATVLLGVGAITVRLARCRRELPYATIPILFGVQQLIEGLLWLTLPDRAPVLNVWVTYIYSFFSHVFWPIYIPLAILALEVTPWRRLTLKIIAFTGTLLGLYLLMVLIKEPISAKQIGLHILYDSPHYYTQINMLMYLIATCASLMVSSHRRVMVFGVVAMISSALAYFFYMVWFFSVWCFFAAILSIIVLWQFIDNGQKPVARWHLLKTDK